MLNKLASIVVVAALVWTLAGTPAFATTTPESNSKTGATADRRGGDREADRVANEKLQMALAKLVADAKAGSNVVTFPRPQIQSPRRNNLSTGTKIAIGVGVAVAIVAVIFISKRCSNEPGSC